jgi:hypothetical protein
MCLLRVLWTGTETWVLRAVERAPMSGQPMRIAWWRDRTWRRETGVKGWRTGRLVVIPLCRHSSESWNPFRLATVAQRGSMSMKMDSSFRWNDGAWIEGRPAWLPAFAGMTPLAG